MSAYYACARSATCTSVTITDFGDFSGTYDKVLDTFEDAYYSMDAGLDTYILYLDSGEWTLAPDEAYYPRYRVSWGRRWGVSSCPFISSCFPSTTVLVSAARFSLGCGLPPPPTGLPILAEYSRAAWMV